MGPSSSIAIFLILTLAFSTFKYYSKSAESIKIWTFIYFLILIVVQFFINLGLTSEICGFTQYTIALKTTLIPWVLIFGSIYILLMVFPNWLSPFSNTFGYFLAYISGINGFFKSILKERGSFKLNKSESSMVNAINNVYDDKSLLINSMTVANLPYWWQSMKDGGLFKQGVGQEHYNELMGYIKMKSGVSEFIWYALTGILTSSISFNYILNSGCTQSAEEMEKRHQQYLEQEKKIAKSKQEKQKNQVIYKSYE